MLTALAAPSMRAGRGSASSATRTTTASSSSSVASSPVADETVTLAYTEWALVEFEGEPVEIGPDETPLEAGMMSAVRLDKATASIGQDALRSKQGQPLRKRLVRIVLQGPEVYAWGGETILIDGRPVGEIASAGWSPKAGACVALGYVRGDAAQREHRDAPAQVELWGERISARLTTL